MRDWRFVAACLGLVAVIIGAQLMASSTYPAASVADAGQVLGRTGFAYITTLRTFAAAVLWNRLEPQFHDYYEGVSLEDQKHILPTLALVQALDPQFVQSYYLSAFVVARRGDMDTGIAIARAGVENNPKNGLMLSNLAQLLIFDDPKRNLAEAYDLAAIGVSKDAVYDTEQDRYESYAIFRDVYKMGGHPEVAARIDATLAEMRESGTELGDHDHDNDGEQDH